MRKRKKGSMQLGINAIVVLIIALAILGLAMSFITGLFRRSQVTYEDIIGRADLDFHADALNPIMFENDQLTVKAGSEIRLDVSVYNNKFDEATDIGMEISRCINSSGEQAWDPNNPYNDPPFLALVAAAQPIPSGTDAGFKTVFTAREALDSDKGTYICTIKAGVLDAQGYVSDSPITPITEQLIIVVTTG